MGAYTVSITENDAAQDLVIEYDVAFYKYDVEEALNKIDEYVRANGFDESDKEEWCNYYYSLADFMWRKGILTDSVRDRALSMIDSGFGLELWVEAGGKTLSDRKKSLKKFREKLLSPLPPKKKRKLNVHLNPIFTPGDIVAISLQTKGKPYTASDDVPMTDDDFHALDGKFILIQLISCRASWTSSLDPDVKDYWADCRLIDGIYDTIPDNLDDLDLNDALMITPSGLSGNFTCESSMFYFKKRGYKIIGNRYDLIANTNSHADNHIFLGVNKPWANPDSIFISAMGRPIKFGEFSGTTESLNHILKTSNRYGRYDYRLSRQENDARYLVEEEKIDLTLKNALNNGGKLLSISFGKEIGVAIINGNCIIGIYIEGKYKNHGFGTMLLEYALKSIGKDAYIDVPKNKTTLLCVCEKLALVEVPTDSEEYVRMRV